MNKGSLVHEDYFDLFKNNNINYNKYTSSQIQPSSLDLTLSEECYEIEASFLSPDTNIRDKLTNIINKKIDNKNNNFTQEFFYNYCDLLMIFQSNTMLYNKLRKIALLLGKEGWVNFIDINIYFNDISNKEALKKLNNILITSQDKKLIDFTKKKIKLISNE